MRFALTIPPSTGAKAIHHCDVGASSFAVQKFILDAVKARCEFLVLETSSHSLDQFRVWGITFRTVVVTNVTREHLDYHQTMEQYRRAKLKLFQKAKNAVVNLDMEKPEEFLQYKNDKKIKYSLKDKTADIFAEDISLGINSTNYKLPASTRGDSPTRGGQTTSFKLNLPGEFNIENALAATSAAVAENIDLETCARALAKIKGVPGRMEAVLNDKDIDIIVDFALTPNALEKIYQLLAKTKKPEQKIIAVFGACGERDRGKRPIIGEIVARYADQVIITNDEPYREDPLRIISEIVAGVKNKKENENLWIIPDRREAIRKALQLARPQDIVAVTGMGAEESMVVGDEKVPWNDKRVILEELEKMQ